MAVTVVRDVEVRREDASTDLQLLICPTPKHHHLTCKPRIFFLFLIDFFPSLLPYESCSLVIHLCLLIFIGPFEPVA